MPDDKKDGAVDEGSKAVDQKTDEGQKSTGGEGDQDKKEKVLTPEEVQQLLSTNERLLNESKSNKAELKRLKAAEEAKEQKRLEDEKKYPELIEKERKRNKEISDRVIAQGIAFEIQKKCADAVDIELVSKLIKIDENNFDNEKLEITDISQQLDEIRKNKPYLFKAKGADMNQKIPSYTPTGNGSDVPLAKQSLDDLSKRVGEGLVGRLK